MYRLLVTILKDVRILIGLGLGSIVAIFLAGWGALAAVDTRVSERVEVKLKVVEDAHDLLRAEVMEQKAELGELRRDVKALYLFEKTGQSQERLEDGGK